MGLGVLSGWRASWRTFLRRVGLSCRTVKGGGSSRDEVGNRVAGFGNVHDEQVDGGADGDKGRGMRGTRRDIVGDTA